jgi:hypothetical protein
MRRTSALGLALFLTLGCGTSATSEGAKSGEPAAQGTTASGARAPCGDDGLYALPPSAPSDLEEDAQGRAGLSAFRVAEENYKKGDPSGAAKMFLQAAQALARVQGDEEVSDYARYAREVSYHNALWSASEAGELPEMRASIQKSAGADTALADAIKAMLEDPPAECAEGQ